MAKVTKFTTARVIDTLPWEALFSVITALDNSPNENVQHLVSDITAEVRTKLFQEMPLVEEEPQKPQGGNLLPFGPSSQKPN